MRIFCFGSDYPPTGGGISTHTHEWLFGLAQEKDIKVRATIFANKESRQEKVQGLIEVTIFQSRNFFYMGWRIFSDMWKYRHYDVFHAFNLFPVGFFVVFFAKLFGKKSVLTFYGADACDKRTSPKVRRLQKYALQNATWALTISEFTKSKVIEEYGLSRPIEVIHPILPAFEKKESKDVRKELGLEDDFVVLSVSRLVQRKGIEYLIQAMQEIQDPKIKLIIVGGGPERERLENLVKESSEESRIIFAGKVPELAPYYTAANVAALVSYVIPEEGDFEGLGLVLLEAQSYGKPVIGSKSGGIPEAFLNGKTGLLVSPKNSHEIRDAILKMKNNPQLYASMSSQTGAFLEKEFGQENTIKKYLKLLTK
jgi:phosphatidylinositol alpha-1,6-mannosyltransferase